MLKSFTNPRYVKANTVEGRVVVSGRSSIQMWYVWDAAHYTRLANDYNFSLSKIKPTYRDGLVFYHQFAWFPLYPVTAKIFHEITRLSVVRSQIVLSNIYFIVALYLIYKLVRVDGDDNLARSAVMFLILMPAAFIFSAALSESLFLMLAIASLYFARIQRWWLMAISAFLLALTRSAGFLIFIPLLIEILQQQDWQVFKKWRQLIVPSLLALASLAGLLAFLFYCWLRTDTFFAYSKSQLAGFGTQILNPVTYILGRLSDLQIMIVLAQLLLVFLLWRKMRLSYLTYALIFTLIAFTAGGNSIYGCLRYTSFIFPVAIAAAYLYSKKVLSYYVVTSFALVQGVIFTLWAVWWTHFMI